MVPARDLEATAATALSFEARLALHADLNAIGRAAAGERSIEEHRCCICMDMLAVAIAWQKVHACARPWCAGVWGECEKNVAATVLFVQRQRACIRALHMWIILHSSNL